MTPEVKVDVHADLPTKSSKLNALIAQALRAGLVVECVHQLDNVLESYNVDVTLPHIDNPTNMLEVVENADRIHIHALRTVLDTTAKPFALHPHKWSYGSTKVSRMKVREATHAIAIMGESLARRNEDAS